MTADNETLVRNAFDALARGDVQAMLELVDPDLEWTFLEPTEVDPEPQVCRGRDQLAYWVGRDSGWRIRPELEELVSFGERVLVVTHSPGIDERRARKTDDRNFHVVTVRGERITALRACRSRQDAEKVAST